MRARGSMPDPQMEPTESMLCSRVQWKPAPERNAHSCGPDRSPTFLLAGARHDIGSRRARRTRSSGRTYAWLPSGVRTIHHPHPSACGSGRKASPMARSVARSVTSNIARLLRSMFSLRGFSPGIRFRCKVRSSFRRPTVPEGASTIDCRGMFLMPGLIDLRFHAYSVEGSARRLDRMPAALRVCHASRMLEAALQRGFTSVRDPGGGDIGLHLAIEQGLIEGPRFFF